jgi:hypothetical protein
MTACNYNDSDAYDCTYDTDQDSICDDEDYCLNDPVNAVDECGVCGGDNSTCADDCGVPNGNNSTCEDDCGVPNGNNSTCEDDCGVPNGDNSTCDTNCGCTEVGACNYDPTATCDDSSCLQDDACGNCGGSGVLNESGECIELYTVADFIRAQITGENNLHMTHEFQVALSLLQELNANNEIPNAMEFLQGHSSGNELFMEFSLQAVVDSLNVILLMEAPIE